MLKVKKYKEIIEKNQNLEFFVKSKIQTKKTQ